MKTTLFKMKNNNHVTLPHEQSYLLYRIIHLTLLQMILLKTMKLISYFPIFLNCLKNLGSTVFLNPFMLPQCNLCQLVKRLISLPFGAYTVTILFFFFKLELSLLFKTNSRYNSITVLCSNFFIYGLLMLKVSTIYLLSCFDNLNFLLQPI